MKPVGFLKTSHPERGDKQTINDEIEEAQEEQRCRKIMRRGNERVVNVLCVCVSGGRNEKGWIIIYIFIKEGGDDFFTLRHLSRCFFPNT